MIFISYRISDSLDLVDRLDVDLTAAFGEANVFRDKSRLEGGQDWTEELERNAKTRKVTLVVIGSTWQSTTFANGPRKGFPRLSDSEDWVRKEITFALDAGNVVIPVLLNGAAMPEKEWLAICGLERLAAKQGETLSSKQYAHDLGKLLDVLRKRCPELPEAAANAPDVPNVILPKPPDLYAVPHYILTSTFIGRATELDDLDAWAKGGDPFMVVEGIGGLGKSALTWEWVQKRAGYAIPNLAGRVWWSFYEKGTTMEAFIRNALAYVRGQDPTALTKSSSHYERSQELLVELKRRPYLLVLDGFERVLTAYHRWDKAQQRDDKIATDLRECVDPRDGELLQQLLHASPSKILLSTRLFPSVLEDKASGSPIPGVAHHKLNGLSRPDALAFYKNAKIKGNEQAMLDFAEEFGNHSLLLKVICGEIASYRRKPYSFDDWRADPVYGGKLKLTDLDLKQRYTHILHFALEGLDEPKRKLLCRIAVLSENADYDTVAVLNPYLPPKPEKMAYPDPGTDWPEEPDERRTARYAEYHRKLDQYHRNEEAVQAYEAAVDDPQTRRDFDKALQELQDRGLLQWDRENGHYDMHPVVRGHAAEWVEEGERRQTFLSVRNHFASLPPDDLKNATDLSQIMRTLEIFRCNLGANQVQAAYDMLEKLFDSLLSNIYAPAFILELLRPFLAQDFALLNGVSDPDGRRNIRMTAGIVLNILDQREEAERILLAELGEFIAAGEWDDLGSALALSSNIFGIMLKHGRVDQATHRCVEIAREIQAVSNGRKHDIPINGLTEFVALTQTGQLPTDSPENPFVVFIHHLYAGTFSDPDVAQMEAEVGVGNIGRELLCVVVGDYFLSHYRPDEALARFEDTIVRMNRNNERTPPTLHDLRAWALARLGRPDDAKAELARGEQRLYAAEAWKALGERDKCLECTLNAYKWAWGEGPPYIHWYTLKRSRELLAELGEPEPQLPPFDPSKVKPVPFEAEIRAAIEKLKAEKAEREKAPLQEGKPDE